MKPRLLTHSLIHFTAKLVAVLQHHLQDLTDRQPGGKQGHHVVELQRIRKRDMVTGHHLRCIIVSVGILFIANVDGLEHPHSMVARWHSIARAVAFPILIAGRSGSLRWHQYILHNDFVYVLVDGEYPLFANDGTALIEKRIDCQLLEKALECLRRLVHCLSCLFRTQQTFGNAA